MPQTARATCALAHFNAATAHAPACGALPAPHAPVVSGPKHQIFLASSLSQPNSSDRILERTCAAGSGRQHGAGKPRASAQQCMLVLRQLSNKKPPASCKHQHPCTGAFNSASAAAAGAHLGVIAGANLALIDGLSQAVLQRARLRGRGWLRLAGACEEQVGGWLGFEGAWRWSLCLSK